MESKEYVYNVHVRGGCCDGGKRFHQASTSEHGAHRDEDGNTAVDGTGGLRVEMESSTVHIAQDGDYRLVVPLSALISITAWS